MTRNLVGSIRVTCHILSLMLASSTFSDDIFSETTRSVQTKFYVEPPGGGGTKICSGCLDSMTKMAAMPYMVKLLKIFLSGKIWPMTLKLDMQHKGLRLYQVCSNDDLWLTLTYFTARSNSVTWAFVWGKKASSGFFWSYCSPWHQSWYSQSAKWFLYKYQHSRSFIDLCPGFLIFSIFIFFSSKTAGLIETKLHLEPVLDGKVDYGIWVTWSRWQPCLYIVKTLKIFFSETEWLMTLKLSMHHLVLRL